MLQTVPDAPTDLEEDISRRTQISVGLKWKAPEFMGGASFVKYSIDVRKEGEQWQDYEYGIEETRYTVIGLQPGYKYYFRVFCENDYGFSLDS